MATVTRVALVVAVVALLVVAELAPHAAASPEAAEVAAASDAGAGAHTADSAASPAGDSGAPRTPRKGKRANGKRKKGRAKKKRGRRSRRRAPNQKLGKSTLVTDPKLKRQLEKQAQQKIPEAAMRSKQNAKNSLMPVFMCTACERASKTVSYALSRRLSAGDTWSDETKAVLWEDIRGVCVDESLFPRKADLYIDGCIQLFTDKFDVIMEALQKRLDPESELYEEDLGDDKFCEEIRVCGEGQANSLDFEFADKKMRGEL